MLGKVGTGRVVRLGGEGSAVAKVPKMGSALSPVNSALCMLWSVASKFEIGFAVVCLTAGGIVLLLLASSYLLHSW